MSTRKKISDLLIPVITLLLLLSIGYIYVQTTVVNEKAPANFPPDTPENLTANYFADCEDALDLIAPCILFEWSPNSKGNLTDGYEGAINGEVFATSTNKYQVFDVLTNASYNISIRAMNNSGNISSSSYIILNYTAVN